MDSDIVSIYEKLRKSYPISLNSSLALRSKYKIDFPILCGASSLGRFEVFFDGVSFPFYAMRGNREVFAHWHLQTPDEAEKTVAAFMEGESSAMPFGQSNNA